VVACLWQTQVAITAMYLHAKMSALTAILHCNNGILVIVQTPRPFRDMICCRWMLMGSPGLWTTRVSLLSSPECSAAEAHW